MKDEEDESDFTNTELRFCRVSLQLINRFDIYIYIKTIPCNTVQLKTGKEVQSLVQSLVLLCGTFCLSVVPVTRLLDDATTNNLYY